jgi:hypothetical protein
VINAISYTTRVHTGAPGWNVQASLLLSAEYSFPHPLRVQVGIVVVNVLEERQGRWDEILYVPHMFDETVHYRLDKTEISSKRPQRYNRSSHLVARRFECHIEPSPEPYDSQTKNPIPHGPTRAKVRPQRTSHEDGACAMGSRYSVLSPSWLIV